MACNYLDDSLLEESNQDDSIIAFEIIDIEDDDNEEQIDSLSQMEPIVEIIDVDLEFSDDNTDHSVISEPTTFENEEFICDGCSAQFFRKKDLRKHLRKNSIPGNPRLKCDFPPGPSKKRKKNELLSKEDYPKCTLCQRVFSYRHHLLRHLKMHSNERTHMCNICGKSFRWSGNLRDHIRSHNDDRPFICLVCGMAFNKMGNLQRHLKTHERHDIKRPFSCPTCTRCFSQKGDMLRHQRVHNGERPYVCETCDLTFTQVGALKRHRRSHTGERPYACGICHQAYTRKENLKLHQKVHLN